jgi:hypothetical protein
VEPIAQPATSFTGWPVTFEKVSRQEGGIRNDHQWRKFEGDNRMENLRFVGKTRR